MDIINRVEILKKLPLIESELGYPKGIIERIIHYIEIENFLQILYSYGIEVLQFLLQVFLEDEDYETCHKITETVRLQNKATGSNYRLK